MSSQTIPLTEFLGVAGGATELQLRFCGDPVLRKKSAPVADITPEIRRFATSMIEAMFSNEGIGLAAPQVGRHIRLITLATNDPQAEIPAGASPGERLLWQRMPVALVNPEIIGRSDEEYMAEEGCLSVPAIYGEVTRPVSIVLRARLINGEPIQIECGGLLSRCILHEIDHLDGVLFVDKLGRSDKKRIAAELRELEKRTQANLGRSL